jgi:hypothetical protein
MLLVTSVADPGGFHPESQSQLNFILDPGSYYIRKKGKFLKLLPMLF